MGKSKSFINRVINRKAICILILLFCRHQNCICVQNFVWLNYSQQSHCYLSLPNTSMFTMGTNQAQACQNSCENRQIPAPV